jgi:SAM-dependent methyltransferase
MSQKWLFDRPWTKDFTEVRKRFLTEFLDSIGRDVKLTSALDVGSALGDFSEFLHGRGLRVVGVDGRAENSAEARRRYPDITFMTADAEELPVAELGKFDLVLCFGLLYHLENPFRTIRQLHSLTNSALIIEAMCLPGSIPLMGLFDESDNHDQSLRGVAFYPSEGCLLKMLHRSGFPHVYRLKQPLPYILYTGNKWRKPTRTILVASNIAISDGSLASEKEKTLIPPDTSNTWSQAEWNPWSTSLSGIGRFSVGMLNSARNFCSRILRPFRRSHDSV